MDWYFESRIENEIIKFDAQSFEDLFCKVMKAHNDKFQKVKASGRKGDKKCDGFIAETGDYYCIYAPEDFNKKYTVKNGLVKIEKDIRGIVKNWTGIKKINYVINDKFKGLAPDIQQLLISLQNDVSLPKIEVFSMEKLTDITLSLSIDKKQSLLGFVPDLNNSVTSLQYDIVEKIIMYLEKNANRTPAGEGLVVPDFSQKIDFNNLSNEIRDQLNAARYQISKVDKFFESSPVYDKETLRNYCNGLYLEACEKIKEDVDHYADKRFGYILNEMSYNKQSKAVNDNVLIIMATFFESCDIFEEPILGGVE